MKKTILLAVGVVVICLALVLTLVTCKNNETDEPTGEVNGTVVTTTANGTTVQGGQQEDSTGEVEIDISDLLPGVSTTAKTSYVTVTDKSGKPVTTYVTVTKDGKPVTTYVTVTDAKGTTKTTYVPVTDAKGTTKTDAQGSVQTTAVAETTAVVQTTGVVKTTVVTVTDPTTTTTTTQTTTTTTKVGETTEKTSETTKTTIRYDSTEGWSPIMPPR